MTKQTNSKAVLFSGVQPTGGLTLGTYCGAIKNWLTLQESYDSLFCLVDLHAITVRQDPAHLKEKTYEGLAYYLACGLDPKKNILFVQSQVPEHTELAWILTCFSSMGELSRMTQFKDKSAKQEHVGTGLFTYPVLMAADILLYQTKLVPVGQDQKQHLELTRDIAIRMNNILGEIFTVPEPYIAPVGAKIMSLQQPTQKMSKSDTDPLATLFLNDSEKELEKKIKRAVTDSGTTIEYSDEKPGVQNLLNIQAALLGNKPQDLVANYEGKMYGHLKVDTAKIVQDALRPIQSKASEYLRDKAELDRILNDGANRARVKAAPTLKKLKEALGFIL